MAINFSADRIPFDRPYYVEKNGVRSNLFTFGTCSYIDLATIDNDSPEKNILVGRFCSMASHILFSGGGNHAYINSVTTYPFEAADIIAKIHRYEKTEFSMKTARWQYNNRNQIIIGSDVCIGRYARILDGVKIGSGAIIGANTVVAKNIPPYAIAVGNPARVVRYRFDAETIKKFMAVKWWNWDIKKVLENVHLMNDAENFLAEHYKPGMGLATYAEIGEGAQLERYIAEGRKIYSFVADFRAVQPLWKRVISGFLKSPRKNSVLLFWLGESATQADFENLKTFVNSIGLQEGKIIHILPQKFSPYLLRNSTHFITTREMVTLECIDWLYGTGVKVISALDDGIFTDEPEVSWNELYAKS